MDFILYLNEVIYMKLLKDEELLRTYLEIYNINSYFSSDLSKYMQVFEFKKGEFLMSTTKQIEYIFFLVVGKCKVLSHLDNGKSVLISYLTPLEIMGEMEILEEIKFSRFDIVASENVIVVGIDFKKLSTLVENDTVFWKSIYRSTTQKLQSTVNFHILSISYSFEHVLANFLINNAIEVNGKIIVEFDSLNDVSQLLGTSYRHLNRVLKKMADERILLKEKNRIEVLNYDMLEELFVDVY